MEINFLVFSVEAIQFSKFKETKYGGLMWQTNIKRGLTVTFVVKNM